MKKLDVLKVSDKKKERWFVYERRRLDWWDNPRAASGAKKNETRKGRIEMSQIVRIYADREWRQPPLPWRQATRTRVDRCRAVALRAVLGQRNPSVV